MRFDDSLQTVLAAESATPFGAQSTWRQLIDLIGRGRAAASDAALTRLRDLRSGIPLPVRQASSRALARTRPPAALVGLFSEDELSVAAPLLRQVELDAGSWTKLLPGLSPAQRAVLRHRRDLPAATMQDLTAFGSVDFVLAKPAVAVDAMPAPDDEIVGGSVQQSAPIATETTGFVAVGAIAMGLPQVAEAMRVASAPDRVGEAPPLLPIEHPADAADGERTERSIAAPVPDRAGTPADTGAAGTFAISELVARIDAFQQQREVAGRHAASQPALFDLEAIAATFRFEADNAGVIRWIEGAERAAIIGLSLAHPAVLGRSGFDGAVAGAFRRRASFADSRMIVTGGSGAAGQWRVSGTPLFDRASGRFTGYRGVARRPRPDESPEPVDRRLSGADGVRQLVHELRTPVNAISGFAEMIEGEMLGPVALSYRQRAASIRDQARDLLGSIDDLDLAARLESNALDLRPVAVPLQPLLSRIIEDLQPLAGLRQARIDQTEPTEEVLAADDRAVERLLARLLATLIGSAAAGERVGVAIVRSANMVILTFDVPAALRLSGSSGLLGSDDDDRADEDHQPLLGAAFALRLAHKLAAELGGELRAVAETLTLRLPAAVIPAVEQASTF